MLTRHPGRSLVTSRKSQPIDCAFVLAGHRAKDSPEASPVREDFIARPNVLDPLNALASDDLLARKQAARFVVVALEEGVGRELDEVLVSGVALGQEGQVLVELLALIAVSARVVDAAPSHWALEPGFGGLIGL